MKLVLTGITSVAGRIMLAAIFLLSAIGNKIPHFNQTIDYMNAHVVPYPSISLVGAIAFLIVGSLLIIAGFQARVGAMLLMVFLVLATYYFHDFWTHNSDSPEYQAQMIQFMKNLGLAGAMVFLICNGPGEGSLDRIFQANNKHNS